MAYAELKLLGTLLVALNTANVFYEFDHGILGLYKDFSIDGDPREFGENEYLPGSGRLVYEGHEAGVFKITITGSHSSTSSGKHFGQIRINGDPSSLPCTFQEMVKETRLLGFGEGKGIVRFDTLAILEPGDHVSFWSMSTYGDPIVYEDLSITIVQIDTSNSPQ